MSPIRSHRNSPPPRSASTQSLRDWHWWTLPSLSSSATRVGGAVVGDAQARREPLLDRDEDDQHRDRQQHLRHGVEGAQGLHAQRHRQEQGGGRDEIRNALTEHVGGADRHRHHRPAEEREPDPEQQGDPRRAGHAGRDVQHVAQDDDAQHQRKCRPPHRLVNLVRPHVEKGQHGRNTEDHEHRSARGQSMSRAHRRPWVRAQGFRGRTPCRPAAASGPARGGYR